MVLLNVIDWLEKHAFTCPIKKHTGLSCFGCGFQSSFFALCRGQFARSFELYPPLLFVLLAALMFCLNYKLKEKRISVLTNWLFGISVFVFIVHGIWRLAGELD